MTATMPVEHGQTAQHWTVKKMKQWAAEVWQCDVSRSALRTLLKGKRMSWKKCQKVLQKANPEKRAAFISEFKALYERVCRGEVLLLYVDQAHVHRDMDLGYTWASTEMVAWRLSHCPSLQERINWYGAYDFNRGACFIWNEGSCNQVHTGQFLRHLADWVGDVNAEDVIIWDGAPWHRGRLARDTAAELGFTLLPLPGYSPDLNPIEGLWKWLREEVTRNHSYATMRALFDTC
ncbi:MAG: IS630 family transposase [Anaerolineales bacterium]|nr:IS630 family transposase [Anaerolineales bacterium]